MGLKWVFDRHSTVRRGIGMFAVLGIATMATSAWADAAGKQAPQTVEDLRGLSLDDLANIRVTSVSKRPEMLSQVPAAIYVITAEDIRRSGATSLPEALRLAPNLEVAQVNAYAWTVTARGFNSPETANKLLVLINGRSVYEPIGSGVLWQQVDVDLASVERIEVTSGPGGTMWGANAVNGVINVITKSAANLPPVSAHVMAGSYERQAGVAFAGKLTQHVSIQVRGNTFGYDNTVAAQAGDTSQDAFKGAQFGVGLTGKWSADRASLGAGGYDNSIIDDGGRLHGEVVRADWSHASRDGSTIDLNTYVSRDIRDEPTLYESRDVFDISAQQTRHVGARQTVIWGGEYRHWWEDFQSFDLFSFTRPKTTISIGSLYAQDEIALKPHLKLTLGLKAENSSYSGFNWLPNVRLAWQPDTVNLWWAAISRAERTPNRIERELQAPGFLVPAPDFGAEKLVAYEAGWRGQPDKRLSLSLQAFYNVYDDLRTDGYPPTIFPIILQNGGAGVTWGVEGWGKYQVTPAWRLSAGFNLLHKSFHLQPGFNDLANLAVQGQDPSYQAQLRSEWNISRTLEFDLGLRNVDKIDNAPVKAYTEADAHIGWRVNNKVQLALDGHNLLHDRHLEVWDPSTTTPRYVPRSIFVSLRYGF